MKGDRASATVFVAVPPADAFAIFTTEIDAWWRTGPPRRDENAGQLSIQVTRGAVKFR